MVCQHSDPNCSFLFFFQTGHDLVLYWPRLSDFKTPSLIPDRDFSGCIFNDTSSSLRKKCRYLELLWSAFSRIRTRLTPNMDTLHAVPANGVLCCKHSFVRWSDWCLVCFFRGSYKQILNCQQKKIQTLKLCPYIAIKANLLLLLYLKKGAETVSKFMNLHKDPFFGLIFRNAHPDAAFLDKFPLLLKLKN